MQLPVMQQEVAMVNLRTDTQCRVTLALYLPCTVTRQIDTPDA